MMKKYIITPLIIALVVFSALWSCHNENDFYELGSQPVSLTHPLADTVIILDYTNQGDYYTFSWYSKRYYIEFNLIFGLDPDFSGQKYERFIGIQQSQRFYIMQLDSVISAMSVGIGQTADVYWTVELVDPTTGWCDEIRKFTITRCVIPDRVIELSSPAENAEIALDKNPTSGGIYKTLSFAWSCTSQADDYVLHIAMDEDFTDPLKIACGSEEGYGFPHDEMDEWLAGKGILPAEKTTLWWKVTATANLDNPIQNSVVQSFEVVRFTPDAVPVLLAAPAAEEQFVLESADADQPVLFQWDCDTTGVAFTLWLYDAEWDVEERIAVGEDHSLSITQGELDILLQSKFGMVHAQLKKFTWKVISDNASRAEDSEERVVYIRRFTAPTVLYPITLLSGPADNTSYTLLLDEADTELASATWESDAPNVTYAVEYSLDPAMSDSKLLELGPAPSVSFTHRLLDDILTDLGGSYLTRTVYWRIASTPAVPTEPSEIRSLNLTGMLRPLVDERDPQQIETYEVVKIDADFWMAENLRATIYSDGTSFTSVDLPSKTYAAGVVADPAVTGCYYTWPTALRDWQQADASEDRIIQGVCPDGWHVSTMADWKAVKAYLTPDDPDLGDASKIKSTEYWAYWQGDNSTGLNLVPSGVFWHGNVAVPEFVNPGSDADDKSGLKSGYWTTTTDSDLTAYTFEVFDWNNESLLWYYQSRPWSEGAATASKSLNVRCVRDRN